MHITITGCSGNVGRITVALALQKGHRVHGVDHTSPPEPEFYKHPEFSYSDVDLRDYDQVLRVLQGSEAVIHLAGVPQPFDYLVNTHNTNVVMSWNVLRAAADVHCIARVAQASSVNVVRLVWSVKPKLYYLPLDEEHPREPDEPYGLSKVVCELQADTIVARYPSMRVASLRPSWVIPDREYAAKADPDTERRKNDLWGWVQNESAAEAFVLAVTDTAGVEEWAGHEAFFIVAPSATSDEEIEHLYEKHWRDVPLKSGKTLRRGFFDCSKAERMLGWVHREKIAA